MLTRSTRPPLLMLVSRALTFDIGDRNLHNGQNLEEVVLGKVLVGVVGVKLEQSAKFE